MDILVKDYQITILPPRGAMRWIRIYLSGEKRDHYFQAQIAEEFVKVFQFEKAKFLRDEPYLRVSHGGLEMKLNTVEIPGETFDRWLQNDLIEIKNYQLDKKLSRLEIGQKVGLALLAPCSLIAIGVILAAILDKGKNGCEPPYY